MSLEPVYGWAMEFTTGSNPYTYQSNIIGGPSSPLVRQELIDTCHTLQRDGKYSDQPPFYTLGPVPRVNPPYYNYILPNVYPSSGPSSSPDPRQYWYFPYYNDPQFWKDPIIRVPKPGF